MITALAGGVGAARLLRGLVRVVSPSDVTAVVNTGDDTELHGLHISPDLDTVTYTLAGLNDDERGWGLAGETWSVMDSLDRLGGETWFRLGDRDLATHLYRTQRLSDRGHLVGGDRRDHRVPRRRRRVSSRCPTIPSAPGSPSSTAPRSSFQEYFVGHRHAVAVESLRFDGADTAAPRRASSSAIADAEVVVVCPSNPIVSIGPLLAVPGIAEALAARRADVVAVSPIIAGAALKGPADRLLIELGHEATVVGVARVYADFVGTLVVDDADAESADAVEACGVRCVVAPTVMHTPDHSAELASLLLDAGRPSGASRGART